MSVIAYAVEPHTKPSRLNRRRKKKWRNSKLTSMFDAAMLSSLPNKTGAGIGTPENKGQKAAIDAVFYCPSKIISAALVRLKFVMVERNRQPQGWPAPLSGSSNLLRSATPRLEPTGDGLSPTKETAIMNTQKPTTAQNHPQKQDQAVKGFLQQIRDLEIERETVLAAGLPALQRLAKIAQRDTGQAVTVRRFLLGLYNGHRWPFDLTTLRGLDRDLFDDCMALLRLDARATVKEVHQYFTNGGELFAAFARMEG